MRSVKRLLCCLAAAAFCTGMKADEGMWMLTDLKTQNAVAMRELGLLIPVDQIYNADSLSLKDAVVHFGGGCTGEVVSAQGLVLTNHHCGYGYIQQHSSVEHDYLTEGFWAANRQEELPCKGLTVTFIDRILDVTSYVQTQLAKDPDPQGVNYLSPAYLKIVAGRFARTEGIELPQGSSMELKAFYGGNKYYLFIKKTYSDVRLVGAPPSSIGKFGADTDNWTWPRHTGDFSLFRIYAAPDGSPASYAPENLPLEVRQPLSISLDGYKEGDFAFVMGFPGRNWRYMTSDEVEERMQTVNFMRIHVRDARQKVLRQEMEADDAVRIHYAAKYASSANYWKNALGMNEGLVKLGVTDTKRSQQEALLAFGKERGDTALLSAFNTINRIVAQRRSALYHQQAIQEALVTALDCMKIPSTAALQTALRSKDKARIAKAADSLDVAAARYFASVPYPEVERKVAKAMLAVYARYIAPEERISIFKIIDRKFKGDTDRFVDACFEHSMFGSKANFDRFMKKPTLYKLDTDWMVLLKYSITDGLLKTAISMAEANRDYNRAHKIWVKGMMDMRQAKGQALYPDANSTLRLTYGKVASYSPADGIVDCYRTTLKGVMQKEDPSNPEFIVPDKLKRLYAEGDYGRYADADGQMTTCFVVDTDNTGGNSGSPVLNAWGKLIGVAFDRNYEGLTGDIAFRPSSQRAICVDIRYVLFVIDKYAGATWIADEMLSRP